MYAIRYGESLPDEFADLRAKDRTRILYAIDVQLLHEPNRQSRNRKLLEGLVPPWEHAGPTWELRVGEYRVFYDLDETEKVVNVRAIRHKPPHKTTDEVL